MPGHSGGGGGTEGGGGDQNQDHEPGVSSMTPLLGEAARASEGSAVLCPLWGGITRARAPLTAQGA